MMRSRPRPATRPPIGTLFLCALAVALAAYFTFAAVQGDFGVLRRMQLSAEAESLTAERDRLTIEVARMENLTHRLSDDYLDLDLLDERTRDTLGFMRADEIAIR